MLMSTPLVEAEQDRSIRVEDLTEVVMGRSRLRQPKQRLVPPKAASHISNTNDRPRTPHDISPVELTVGLQQRAVSRVRCKALLAGSRPIDRASKPTRSAIVSGAIT